MRVGLAARRTRLYGCRSGLGLGFLIFFVSLKSKISKASKEDLETVAVGKWTLQLGGVSGIAAEADHGRDNGPRRQTLRQYRGDVGRTSDRFQNNIVKWKLEIPLFRNNTGFVRENHGLGDVETVFDRQRFGINMLSSL